MRKAIPFALIVATLSGLFSLTPWAFQLEERFGLSWLFHLRGVQVPTDVVVISLDWDTLNQLEPQIQGRHEEWPRRYHAQLVDRLARAGVELIAFDIFFAEPRDHGSDQQLGRAIARAGNVLLYSHLNHSETLTAGGLKLSSETLQPPLEVIAQGAACTAPFVLPDIQAPITRLWLFKPEAGDIPTLPVCAFQLHLQHQWPAFMPTLARLLPGLTEIRQERNLNETVHYLRRQFQQHPELAEQLVTAFDPAPDAHERQLLDTFLSIHTGGYSRFIDFYGPAHTLPTLSYHRVLAMSDEELVSELGGREIFIGVSEGQQWVQRDTLRTPFTDQTSGLRLAGVEIIATGFANLLHAAQITLPERWHNVLLHAIFALLCAICARSLGAITASLLNGMLCAAWFAVGLQLFTRYGLWLPLVTPIFIIAGVTTFTGILLSHRALTHERKQIYQAFAEYLPTSVVDSLSRDIAGYPPSTLMRGVCLISDVEHFTNLSETLSPVELAQVMNRYRVDVFEPVEESGGYISEVLGDALVAMWVRPEEEMDNRRMSCEAALRVLQRVDVYNQTHPDLRMPLRIGMHYGEFLMADQKAGSHHEYRVIGDIINAASRLEGANKHLHTHLMVSGAVAEGVEGILFRTLGRFRVAGKAEALTIYQPLSIEAETSPAQRSLVEQFHQALAQLQSGDWQSALQAFSQLHDTYPDDGPCEFYLNRCQEFVDTPPKEWDGTLYLGKM